MSLPVEGPGPRGGTPSDQHISSAEEARETPPDQRPRKTTWKGCSVCDVLFETEDEDQDSCFPCRTGTYEDPDRPQPPPEVLRPSRRRHDAGARKVAVEEVPVIIDADSMQNVPLDSSPDEPIATEENCDNGIAEGPNDGDGANPPSVKRPWSAMDKLPMTETDESRSRVSAPGRLERETQPDEPTGGGPRVIGVRRRRKIAWADQRQQAADSNSSEYQSSTTSSTPRSSSSDIRSSEGDASEQGPKTQKTESQPTGDTPKPEEEQDGANPEDAANPDKTEDAEEPKTD